MGGSLGLALKRRGLSKVSLYARREETRSLALSMGVADDVFDSPDAALRGADCAVFCTPICSIPDMAHRCAGFFEPGCIVTDVGSTKSDLAKAMRMALQGTSVVYVGSHPMAGSEKMGIEAARSDLYQGAVTAITPEEDIAEHAIGALSELWRGVGAKVVRISVGEHDSLVARTSHLPHLAASMLAMTVGRGDYSMTRVFCGPGFRDTTRVASGSPDVWHDIVKTNRDAVLLELKAFGDAVAQLSFLIEREDYEGVRKMLEAARDTRQALLG